MEGATGVSSDSEREKLIRIIEEAVENSRDNWKKVAFYSDPDVASILERLYEAWEANERRGKPIDYATLDDLRVLATKAKSVKPVSPWSVYNAISKPEEEKANRRPNGVLKRLLSRLLGIKS